MITTSKNQGILTVDQKEPYTLQIPRKGAPSILIECIGLDKLYAVVNIDRTRQNTFIADQSTLSKLFDKLNNRKRQADPEIVKWIERQMAPILDVGRAMEEGELAGNYAQAEARGNKYEQGELSPSTEEQENSLQTKQEADFYLDPTLQKAVDETLSLPSYCANKKIQDLQYNEYVYVKDPKDPKAISKRISVARTYLCVPGAGLLPSMSRVHYYYAMDDIAPISGGQGKVIFSYFKTNISLEKKLEIRKILKSTKIGAGLSFNLSSAAGLAAPGIGDKVFKNGLPSLVGTPPNQSQLEMSFNLQKQHYELRLRAETRYTLAHGRDGAPLIIDI